MAAITLHGKKYVTKAKIGRGGQGIVWEAENGGAKPVVLKELYGIVTSDSPDPEVSDVEKQVEILRQLQGVRGIPSLIDAGFADDGRYYIAMNHVSGKTLEEHVQEEKRYTQAEATEVLQQLLHTLNECHSRGLIHRDVKPDNIKISEGEAIFVDVNSFGDALAKTQTIAIGTLGYVAPEQKNLQTKPASDIYGLGKTLYHILTRENISGFSELKSTDFDGIRTVYGTGFGNILEKMCQPEIEKRYKTVAEVLHDLSVGHVTEKFALVATQKNGVTQKPSRFSRIWDWVRYKTIARGYNENGLAGEKILRKRFGYGPETLIQDNDGKCIYGTENLDGIIFKYNNTRGDDSKLHVITLNGNSHLIFKTPEGKEVLISRDGKMFGEPFDAYDNPIHNPNHGDGKGKDTDYIAVLVYPTNSHTLVQQWLGKDGLIGICEKGIEEVELFNEEGWTKVRKDDGKQAIVSPDGKILGGKWFDQISASVAVDKNGTLYIPVSEGNLIQLINEKGEGFGPKISGGELESVHKKLTTSFEIWNGKEYAHFHWEDTVNYPYISHTYIAKDGSLIGGKEKWRNVTLLHGPAEQYAVCEELYSIDGRPKKDATKTVKIVDKDNSLVFGGAHNSWNWYSPQGGLEAMCFSGIRPEETSTTGVQRDEDRNKVVKDKAGNLLYMREGENLENCRFYEIDRDGVVLGDAVVRKVKVDRIVTGSFFSVEEELRTQDGTVLCGIQGPQKIVSYDKTADGKLSVLLSNGANHTIDVVEIMKRIS